MLKVPSKVASLRTLGLTEIGETSRKLREPGVAAGKVCTFPPFTSLGWFFKNSCSNFEQQKQGN